MFSAWNDQQTSHFYCKRQDFHPFSWQILVLPALALPIRNLCLPMEPSVPTTSPALLPSTRWLCWADCLWPQSLVKNSFFIFGLSSSANILYKLTSTLYAGFLFFLTFFYKVDKFKAFSLFFVVLKFHSYVCKDVGETSYTDFILKCSLHSIFHISFHTNFTSNYLPSKFNQLPCFFIIAALANLASSSKVHTSLYTSFHLPWTDTAPYFSVNVASSPFSRLPRPLSTFSMCLNRVSAERWFSLLTIFVLFIF